MNAAYDLGDDAWRQLGVEALRQGEWVSSKQCVYCYRGFILFMRSALEVVTVSSLHIASDAHLYTRKHTHSLLSSNEKCV
jgi:hypothetical protein